MRPLPALVATTGAVAGAAVGAYRLMVAGALTLDVGVGRRVRPLADIDVDIAAPRTLVYDVIASPYLDRTPRAMADKLEVLERGSDMVLAAHHTDLGGGRRATTVETVRFDRPARVDFRLVRGPVPHVTEQFLLDEHDGGTTLRYRGELATDLWAAGAWWGDRVATAWEAVVTASLQTIKQEAERRALAGS